MILVWALLENFFCFFSFKGNVKRKRKLTKMRQKIKDGKERNARKEGNQRHSLNNDLTEINIRALITIINI